MLKIKNWSSFQSYKDRRPPWIRLSRDLLDNYEYHSMSANARALLPLLWLLASEDIDPVSGLLRIRNDKIAFRLRMQKKDVDEGIKEIVAAGFIEEISSLNQQVTEPLRNGYESVTPEAEREIERYRKNGERTPSLPKEPIKLKTPVLVTAREEVGVLKNGFGDGEGMGFPHYDVQRYLSDDDLRMARVGAPGWDIYHLIRVYNSGIHDGTRKPPTKPGKAFPVWCQSYTKGKRP